MDLDARISTGGPQMGSARAAELVERLSGALQRQHLNLDEEHALLEALLDITAVQGNPDESINFAVQDSLPLDEQGWTLLVTYTFERRYGWSESADCNNDRAMDSLDNRAKKKINESLEQLLAWLKEQPLKRPIFQAFVAVAPASHKPVVRQRCYLHFLEWMKWQANSDDFGERVSDLEDLMQKAIISALTDVWSATRKACAQRFKTIGQLLTLQHLQGLFSTFLDAWNDAEDARAWKAKEGILLGLAAVISQFSQMDNTYATDASNASDIGVNIRLRFGAEELDALPGFITEHLKPLLFGALAHPQLSVRENAAKAFSSYLSRTPLHETQVCLAQVIRKLQCGRQKAQDGGGVSRSLEGVGWKVKGGSLSNSISSRGTPDPKEEQEACGRPMEADGEVEVGWRSRRGRREVSSRGKGDPPLSPSLPEEEQEACRQGEGGKSLVLVEAFEAQGLLSLASDLLERLPSSLILEQWEALMWTCSLYLAHGASTVRQACSSLFLKFMAKRDQGAGSLQRLVLQGLSTTCTPPLEPDSDGASGSVEGTGGPAAGSGSAAAVGEEDSELGAWTWEGREGRLLAYELVLGFLVEDHTLKMFKSDPRLVSVPGVICSPKKMSPVDSGECNQRWCDWNQRCDPTLSDKLEREGASSRTCEAERESGSKRLERESGSKRPQSPDAEAGTRCVEAGSLLPQTNLSPYNAAWLQSPATEARLHLPAAPDQQSRCRGSGGGGGGGGGGGSPARSDMSVLDKFRFTDDSCCGGGGGGGEGGVGGGEAGGGHVLGMTVTFEPLRVVLDRMFEEVRYSIGHDRWELRRMALQVLPLLCTTALWYESTLLEHLWKRWLLAERVCVSKNKLQPVLQPVWQQPAAACEEADVSRPHAHHLGTRHKKPPPSQRMLEKAEAQQAVAAALAPALALCPPALAPPDVAGGEAVNRAPPSLDAPRAEALNKSVVGALNREGVVEALNRGYVGALALKEILKKILEYVDFVRAPAAAGVAVAHDTVRRIRAACAWLEGLLPELLPAVDALLAKPPHTNLPHSKLPLRVGSVAVDVLMHIHCRFPQAAAMRQREEVVLITHWLTALYASAHAPETSPHAPEASETSAHAPHPSGHAPAPAARDASSPLNSSRTQRACGSGGEGGGEGGGGGASAAGCRNLSPSSSGMSSFPSNTHTHTNARKSIGNSSSASPLNDTRYRQGRRAAENVERALLTEIAPLLPGFVASCDIAQMLYLAPLLVTTLAHYPQELSIQLQVVEAMHRILHLPLSCWTDALTHEEGASSLPQQHGADTETASEETSLSYQRAHSSHSDHHHAAALPLPAARTQERGAQERGGQMHVDGNVPPDKPPSALVASDVASAAQGLPLLRLRSGSYASRSLRNYASCCTPLRGQRRYSYLRPHLLDAEQLPVLPGAPSAAAAVSAASPQAHHHQQQQHFSQEAVRAGGGEGAGGRVVFVGSSSGGGGGGGGGGGSSSRPFEQACEAFVDALLRIVEMQNTEISLFRAVLTVLYSVCCAVGDARFLPRILLSLSIRLRTTKNHHSPAGELERLKLRSNCIRSSEERSDKDSSTTSSTTSSISHICTHTCTRSSSAPSSSEPNTTATPEVERRRARGCSLCSTPSVLTGGTGGEGEAEQWEAGEAGEVRRSIAMRRALSLAPHSNPNCPSSEAPVVNLTIDTGNGRRETCEGEGGLRDAPLPLKTNVNGGESVVETTVVEDERVGEEEEEEGSDWDETDDWSDEEDLAAFEVEVASFFASVNQLARQWTGEVGTPEHRRRVRRLLNVEHDPKYLRELEEQLREMPVTVRAMVQRLQCCS